MFLFLEFQLFQSSLNAILERSEYLYFGFESGGSPLSLLYRDINCGRWQKLKSDFLVALTQLAAERNLPRDKVMSAIEAALVSAF